MIATFGKWSKWHRLFPCSRRSSTRIPTTNCIELLASSTRPSCQDFGPKGQGVTSLCERAVVKGNLMGQTEERKSFFTSEQGGFLCNTITHLFPLKYGMTLRTPVSVS